MCAILATSPELKPKKADEIGRIDWSFDNGTTTDDNGHKNASINGDNREPDDHVDDEACNDHNIESLDDCNESDNDNESDDGDIPDDEIESDAPD